MWFIITNGVQNNCTVHKQDNTNIEISDSKLGNNNIIYPINMSGFILPMFE